MNRRVPLAALGVWLLAAGAAHAQPRVGSDLPLLISVPDEPTRAQRPFPPLAPAQQDRLRRVQSLRQGSLHQRAKDLLDGLLAEAPHHPQVVTELARVHAARRDWAAVERLGRAERTHHRDSLLLARELAVALEHLRRPREAAQVILEAWMAAPAESEWARSNLLHLAASEPRAVRDMTQRFADRAPGRHDLLLGLAQLHWQMGDARTALRALGGADRSTRGGAVRLAFADALLDRGTPHDTTGALEAIHDLAGDPALEPGARIAQAHRAWQIHVARRTEPEGAQRMARALADLAPSRWPAELLGGVVRGLRQAGLTAQARALLARRGEAAALPPELAVEHALADLRDGPPARALPALAAAAPTSPEAAWLHAEALFFAGMSDSALKAYQSIAQNPRGAFTGASLERIYLLEENEARAALPAFGRMAYETWRGDSRAAAAIADSLYRSLPPGPAWAHAALALADRRAALGDARAAIEPLLALADSLPDDRLAPVARQRAGDLYLTRLKDEARAAAQYEECLARYPRAWNAPEIRRKLETLRRERRF